MLALIGILVKILIVVGATQGVVAYLILVERKVAAYAQDRIGPNRCGREFGLPFGLLQPLADGAKMILKEDVIPNYVTKPLFLLAPSIAIIAAMIAFAVVPFGPVGPSAPWLPWVGPDLRLVPALNDTREIPKEGKNLIVVADVNHVLHVRVFDADGKLVDDADEKTLAGHTRQVEDFKKQLQPLWPPHEPTRSEKRRIVAAVPPLVGHALRGQLEFQIAPAIDVGIIYIFAIGSLAVYGVILGGWASNNKYSFLGGLRSSAQLISYEIPLGLSILGMVLLAGSLDLNTIINWQDGYVWGIVVQPIGCLLFMTSAFAETNRLPFDLPEAEQELVGGYHTEYSAMKFGMFFLGEYLHVITVSYLTVVLFFGGWDIPFVLDQEQAGWIAAVAKVLVMIAKVALMIFFMMWVRWTLPRFRYDQLMDLAWKSLIPLALVNLVATATIVHLWRT
jgi:NADH-quinone oxidoreductase subunit H